MLHPFSFDIDVKSAMTPREPYPLIDKVIRHDSTGKSFTKSDWLFACQMWPNLGRGIKESEEKLVQLLQQGKVRELEPDKYQPAEKLSGKGLKVALIQASSTGEGSNNTNNEKISF